MRLQRDLPDSPRWTSVVYAKGYLTALLMLNTPAHGGRLSSSGDLPAVVAFGAGQGPLVLRDALRKGGTASERPCDTDGAHLLEMEVAILRYLREYGNQARVEATSAAVGGLAGAQFLGSLLHRNAVVVLPSRPLMGHMATALASLRDPAVALAATAPTPIPTPLVSAGFSVSRTDSTVPHS